MPYLIEPAKENLNPFIQKLSEQILTGGELNYAITRLTILYVKRTKVINYGSLAERGWAHISAAAMEWYRKAMGPYEDKKAAENGNVYDELFEE